MSLHKDCAKVGAEALEAEFTVHVTKSVKWPVGRKQGKLALRDLGRLSRAPMAPSTHRTNPLRATPAVTTPWSAVKVSHKVGHNITILQDPDSAEAQLFHRKLVCSASMPIA